MVPYIKMAFHHGFEVDILEPETLWKFNVKDLSLKNKHGVPKHKIAQMKDKYESNACIESLIKKFREPPGSKQPNLKDETKGSDTPISLSLNNSKDNV